MGCRLALIGLRAGSIGWQVGMHRGSVAGVERESSHVGDEVEAAVCKGQRGVGVEVAHEALGGLHVGLELGLVEALHDVRVRVRVRGRIRVRARARVTVGARVRVACTTTREVGGGSASSGR